jgi:hypothetical protein
MLSSTLLLAVLVLYQNVVLKDKLLGYGWVVDMFSYLVYFKVYA